MIKFGFAQKILCLALLPLIFAQVGTLVGVMKAAESDMHATTREKLRVGSTVVNQHLGSRVSQSLQTLKVLASDYALKEVVALGNAASIRSALDNHGRRVNADFVAFVRNEESAPVTTKYSNTPALLDQLKQLEFEETETTSTSTVSIKGQHYQIYAVPLKAPTLVGHLVFGIHIDQSLIKKLEALTGLEVALTFKDINEERSIFSLNQVDTEEQWLDSGAAEHTVYNVDSTDGSYLASYTIIDLADDELIVVLRQSVEAALAPYHVARTSLAIFGGLILLFAAGVGVLFAKSLTGPLRQLTSVAERMKEGAYDTPLPDVSNDEIGHLRDTFRSLQLAISDREASIRYQSMHDPLTDLPNQISLNKELRSSLQDDENSSIALIAINLSGMQKIKSSIGQNMANDLLIQISKIIELHLPPGGKLFHTGTNEYFVYLCGETEETAVRWISKVATQLSSGVILSSQDILITSHSGVAMFPEHGTDISALIRRARIASSDAHTALQPVCSYLLEREEALERQVRIVNDIPGAIKGGQFEVVYQPKVKLSDGSVYGAEALVRWHHPELGFLSPDEFIPAAESTGTIVDLTRYVIEQSALTLQSWRERGNDFCLGINLSARDLLSPDLTEYVRQTFDEKHIPYNAVTLEVTETSVMENLEKAVSTLNALRSIGIRTSIDDFGTGQSSLSQLQRLPVDELKIDKSFVINLSTDSLNEVLVSTSITLAKKMGLSVVAEGVEDEQSARKLAGLGCEVVQGFYFSKPLSKSDFNQWLENYNPVPYVDRRSTSRPFARNDSSSVVDSNKASNIADLGAQNTG